MSLSIDPDVYVTQVAAARTFTVYEDIEELIKLGKIKFPKLGAEMLIRQIVGFGSEAHDDIADAFTIIAHQAIERVGSTLDLYKLDVGAYPTTEEGLAALRPYLRRVSNDPWNRPYVYAAPGGNGPRVGLTVGKVMGKAVDRNRIKRRMREAVRRSLNGLNAPVDIVLHPRRAVMDLEFAALEREVSQVFRKIEATLAKTAAATPGVAFPCSPPSA